MGSTYLYLALLAVALLAFQIGRHNPIEIGNHIYANLIIKNPKTMKIMMMIPRITIIMNTKNTKTMNIKLNITENIIKNTKKTKNTKTMNINPRTKLPAVEIQITRIQIKKNTKTMNIKINITEKIIKNTKTINIKIKITSINIIIDMCINIYVK